MCCRLRKALSLLDKFGVDDKVLKMGIDENMLLKFPKKLPQVVFDCYRERLAFKRLTSFKRLDEVSQFPGQSQAANLIAYSH